MSEQTVDDKSGHLIIEGVTDRASGGSYEIGLYDNNGSVYLGLWKAFAVDEGARPEFDYDTVEAMRDWMSQWLIENWPEDD